MTFSQTKFGKQKVGCARKVLKQKKPIFEPQSKGKNPKAAIFEMPITMSEIFRGGVPTK